MGSPDSEDASEMPPKEIWLLGDHLFNRACQHVRQWASAVLGSSGEPGDPVHHETNPSLVFLWQSFSPVLEELAGSTGFHSAVTTCLSLGEEGDFVHPWAVFGRRNCSRPQKDVCCYFVNLFTNCLVKSFFPLPDTRLFILPHGSA